MKRRRFMQLAAVACAITGASVPTGAQIMTGTAGSFATISLAGLGGSGTTVAGDARLPILPSNVTYAPAGGANAVLHIRANSLRHTIRQLDIEVRGPRSGQRYEFGAAGGGTLHIRLDAGAELTAEAGHGNITILSWSAARVTGSYEGTFRHGAVPLVIRGRFEAGLPGS